MWKDPKELGKWFPRYNKWHVHKIMENCVMVQKFAALLHAIMACLEAESYKAWRILHLGLDLYGEKLECVKNLPLYYEYGLLFMTLFNVCTLK